MARRDFTTSTDTSLVNIVTQKPLSMNSKEIFGERIRYFRKRAGYLQPALAEELGVSKNTISNWEAGRARPDLDNIVQMCKVLRITPSQLFGAENAITHQDRVHIQKYHRLNGANKKILDVLLDQLLNTQELAQRKRPDLVLIPKVLKPLAAGIGDPTEVYDESEMVYVHAGAIKRHVDYVFTVNGESMEPNYHSGDMVMVQTVSSSGIDVGDIGAFEVGNELFIKEYRKDGLYSHNPEYEPMHFSEYTDVYLIGKVVGILDKSALADNEEIDLYESFAAAER